MDYQTAEECIDTLLSTSVDRTHPSSKKYCFLCSTTTHPAEGRTSDTLTIMESPPQTHFLCGWAL